MRGSMATKPWLFSLSLLMAGQAFAFGQGGTAPNMAVCQGKVEAPAQCHWVAGAISIFDGTPAVRIRERRSAKTYAVGPSEHELMPDDLKSRLTVSNTIEGDFRICPIEKVQKYGLREVCVDDSSGLRVINR